jgi:hypothetical protein
VEQDELFSLDTVDAHHRFGGSACKPPRPRSSSPVLKSATRATKGVFAGGTFDQTLGVIERVAGPTGLGALRGSAVFHGIGAGVAGALILVEPADQPAALLMLLVTLVVRHVLFLFSV